jgi:3-dehydroquinate synthetase
MGEVAKCWLLEGRSSVDLAQATLTQLIEMSVALKARVVALDEFERSGTRALLNYGHTLGHALERSALARGHDELRHGEAVSIGLAFAVRLARELGRVGDDVVAECDAVLDFFSLPRECPRDLDVEEIIDLMSRDKKAHHDLTFVLAGEGGVEVVSHVPVDRVRRVLEQFREA